jgi:hypothetical protein
MFFGWTIPSKNCIEKVFRPHLSYLVSETFLHMPQTLQSKVWTARSQHLTLCNIVVTICTAKFNIHKFYVLPTHCIYVFCMDLRTNFDYFPIEI